MEKGTCCFISSFLIDSIFSLLYRRDIEVKDEKSYKLARSDIVRRLYITVAGPKSSSPQGYSNLSSPMNEFAGLVNNHVHSTRMAIREE